MGHREVVALPCISMVQNSLLLQEVLLPLKQRERERGRWKFQETGKGKEFGVGNGGSESSSGNWLIKRGNKSGL